MVGELHALGLVGMQHRGVELDQRAVEPEITGAPTVEPHPFGDDGEEVVAMRVGQVARADLGAHVPAVERRRGKPGAGGVQPHVADDRDGVPTQAELLEPWEPRVTQRHLAHEAGG